MVHLLNDISILNILIWQYFLALDISLHGLHGFVSDENLFSRKAKRNVYVDRYKMSVSSWRQKSKGGIETY